MIAPHPDDESIGCGGLIARLCDLRQPVAAVLLTDGAMSHPASERWPQSARVALRLAEFHAALRALGVDAASVHAMGWPDGALPGTDAPGFAGAVSALTDCLAACLADFLADSRTARHADYPADRSPTTLLVPWRRDPHPDHRAASAIARASNARLERPARVLEYPVWTQQRGSVGDQPRSDEATQWSVDIAAVIDCKLLAIAAHLSQLGGVIDDDPSGFVLPPEMLARCAQPIETFYEVTPP